MKTLRLKCLKCGNRDCHINGFMIHIKFIEMYQTCFICGNKGTIMVENHRNNEYEYVTLFSVNKVAIVHNDNEIVKNVGSEKFPCNTLTSIEIIERKG